MNDTLSFRQGLTICAPITATGGAVSLVRISGSESFKILIKACPFLKLKELRSHQMYYGMFKDDSGESLDEVLVSYFAKGKSYTGEESFEISFHGSPYIVEKALKTLIFLGATLAQKGEFTFRGFLNGKMDLTQAEAVVDVIGAHTHKRQKASLALLKGDFSSELKEIETTLLKCISHLEAQIDFTEEELVFLNYKELQKLCKKAAQKVRQWEGAFESRALSNGFSVGLYGHVNVGKSTLLNFLLKKEKAIVTDQAGTTTDIIEGRRFIGDNLVEFYDTAGLRETKSPVESQGVEKAKALSKELDVLVYLVDATCPKIDKDFIKSFKDQGRLIVLANKADAISQEINFDHDIKTSSMTGQGVDELLSLIEKKLNKKTENLFDKFLIKQRHHKILASLSLKLEEVISLFEAAEDLEIIILELQQALGLVYEMTGQRFDEQVIDHIFQEFCLGK